MPEMACLETNMRKTLNKNIKQLNDFLCLRWHFMIYIIVVSVIYQEIGCQTHTPLLENSQPGVLLAAQFERFHSLKNS